MGVKKYQGILRPKGKRKGIMISDFLLPWSKLNPLSLSPQQQEELVSLGIPTEAVTYFEYLGGSIIYEAPEFKTRRGCARAEV